MAMTLSVANNVGQNQVSFAFNLGRLLCAECEPSCLIAEYNRNYIFYHSV